jgi:uncharacterized phage protein (TIGR01671 family)
MDRIIKFRAWDGERMQKAFDITQNPVFWWKDNYDFPLMQFTGLRDRNGTEIYEGDIVKCGWYKSAAPGCVYFGNYSDGEYVENIWCWMIDEGTPLQDSKYNEVIGNIYENKGLIK